MHDLYFAEIYRPGGYVLPLKYGSLLIRFYTASPGKSNKVNVVRYGRSRSFKVIDIVTNQKNNARLPISLPL